MKNNKKPYGIITIIFLIAVVLVLIMLWGNQKNDRKVLSNIEPDSLFSTEMDEINRLVQGQLDEIAKNIASPVEITSSIKKLDYKYFHNFLLDIKLSRFKTSTEKAIALGGLGTDLMYINFFKQQLDMVFALDQLRRLSQDLYISQFFDFYLLKNLSANTLTKAQIDSIIFITTFNLNQMENYLLTEERIETGIFMVLGAWTEGIHLLSRYALLHNDEIIYEKLGEQSFFIQELIKLLELLEKNKKVKTVLSDMESLKALLLAIEVKYKNIGEPMKTTNLDGNEAWYQWQESHVLIDSVYVKEISNEVDLFRTKLFKL